MQLVKKGNYSLNPVVIIKHMKDMSQAYITTEGIILKVQSLIFIHFQIKFKGGQVILLLLIQIIKNIY